MALRIPQDNLLASDVALMNWLRELAVALNAVVAIPPGSGTVTSVIFGAGMAQSGTAADPAGDIIAADGTILVNPDSIQVGTITDANIDDSIATEDDVEALDLSIGAVLEALLFQSRILRAIDEKIAFMTNRLPFLGDDESNVVQLTTSLLLSIDNNLADQTGTIPFSED